MGGYSINIKTRSRQKHLAILTQTYLFSLITYYNNKEIKLLHRKMFSRTQELKF